MAKTTLRAVVDDGTREIVLANSFGKEICKVYFRPADLSIMDRYNALRGDFEDIIKPLADMDIKNDGSAGTDEDWAKIKQVETELKKRINNLFDMEEADAIFASRNPFSSVGGKFFVQHVIEALGGVIEQAMAEELKTSEQHVKKYLKPAQKRAAKVTHITKATLPAKKPATKKATTKKPAAKKKGAK